MAFNTVLALDGFEVGALLNGIDLYYNSVANASIQSSTVRSGNHAVRINPAASRGGFFEGTGAGNHRLARFYIYFATLPDADVPLWYGSKASGGILNAGLAYNNATGRLRSFLNDATSTTFGADGPALVTGVWYRIDILLLIDQTGGSASTVDWQIDGTAQAQLSATVSGGSGGGMIFGNLQGATIVTATNVCTMDVFFDDFIYLSDNAANDLQYPLGAGSVIPVFTIAEGTHSGSGNFIDDAANSPPVTPELRIDDDPHSTTAADYISQNAVSSTSYLEFILGDLPAFAGTAHGWVVDYTRRSVGTAAGNCFVKGYDGTEFAIASPTTSSPAMRARAVGMAGGSSGRLSQSQFNAMTLRLGYATSIGNVDEIHALLIQAAIPSAEKYGWGILA